MDRIDFRRLYSSEALEYKAAMKAERDKNLPKPKKSKSLMIDHMREDEKIRQLEMQTEYQIG